MVFFHVDMSEESIKYTSFIVPDGQYEFRKVPFGLCNAPSVFQRYVNKVFEQLIRENVVVVYMDDVIVPSKSEFENLRSLERVFRVASENGLQIKF